MQPPAARARRRAASALVLAAVLAGCASYSDPPAGWEGPFTVDTVLERALETQGVPEAPPAPAQDFVATLAAEQLNPPAAFDMVVMWKAPNLWRIDQSDGSGKALRLVSDGAKLSRQVEGGPPETDLPLRSAGLHRFAYYLFPVRSFRDGPGEPARLEDVTRWDGGEAIRLSKVDPFGNRYVLSLDAKTLQPLSIREGLPDANGRIVLLDTHLFDFAPDERGGMIPHRLDTHADGKLRERLVLRQLRWNQSLRDADFALR